MADDVPARTAMSVRNDIVQITFQLCIAHAAGNEQPIKIRTPVQHGEHFQNIIVPQ